MGIGKAIAAAVAKEALHQTRKASKNYCTVTRGRHQWTQMHDGRSEFTGRDHTNGGHAVIHCAKCGFVK